MASGDGYLPTDDGVRLYVWTLGSGPLTVVIPNGMHRAFYPVFVHRLARLLYASFRPHLATIALAFSPALHLHQVGRRTLTSKLLTMPSTRLNRFAVESQSTIRA